MATAPAAQPGGGLRRTVEDEVRVLFRLPEPLRDELAARAKRRGVSLNSFMIDTLVGALDDADDCEGGLCS